MLTLGAGTSGGVERTIWQCVAHGPSTGAGARVGSWILTRVQPSDVSRWIKPDSSASFQD